MHVYTGWGEFVISWWWLLVPAALFPVYAIWYVREVRELRRCQAEARAAAAARIEQSARMWAKIMARGVAVITIPVGAPNGRPPCPKCDGSLYEMTVPPSAAVHWVCPACEVRSVHEEVK